MWSLVSGVQTSALPIFVISRLRLPSLDHDTVVRWIQSPLTVVPLVLLIANVFWHFRLGLQVAIEDYVDGGGRIAAIIALHFYTIGGAAHATVADATIEFKVTAA